MGVCVHVRVRVMEREREGEHKLLACSPEIFLGAEKRMRQRGAHQIDFKEK